MCSVPMRFEVLMHNDPWRLHEFRFEDDRFLLNYGGGTHAWRRALAEERPDWLDARLAAANSKMDATDTREEPADQP